LNFKAQAMQNGQTSLANGLGILVTFIIKLIGSIYEVISKVLAEKENFR